MPASATTDALTDEEKERSFYHLGYPETSTVASYQLGIPKPLQAAFLVTQAVDLITNSFAVRRVRCLLQILDSIEAQLVCAQKSLQAEQLGKLTLHPLRSQGKLFTDSLRREYRDWGLQLANVLGVPVYPFAGRYRKSGPGTVLRVRC